MDKIQQAFAQLGLTPDASLKDVRQAYRNLVRSWHPDRFSDNPQQQLRAQERLKEINAAYQLARKNITVRQETAPVVDSPFRFDSALFPTSSGPPSAPESASPPAAKEELPQQTKLLPSISARPIRLNLLLVILSLACSNISWHKFGLSIQGVLYFFQIMTVPFICALICNTSFGTTKSLRAGYLVAIILFGAMVAIDAVSLQKEARQNMITGPSGEEELLSGGGGKGGALPGPPTGSALGPYERSFPTGPRAPESPLAPASPMAPSPLQPSSPVVPRAK